jgi:acetylornithine deacetylase/succinyl-diaminopimelate desuccinylase-like protein
MGWAMDPNAEATKDAIEAMRQAFGTDPINKGEGGSIPFIPELQRLFPKAQVLVTGPEDPKSNAHSPNESISLAILRNGIVAEALLLDKLGQ